MFVEKKNFPKQLLGKIRGLINSPNVMVKSISPSIQILRDGHIPTRDRSYVIISLHPGRQDVVCSNHR
jgi:hypothetical protein